ncbi:MAG: TonB-dependent receptor [Bdellovibrionota bacterium]
MKRALALMLVLGWMPPAARAEEGFVRFEGTLLEKGTRKPLPEVNVYVLPSKLKVTTDAQGNFAIEHVPTGKFTWVVNLTNYERLEKLDEQLVEGANARRTLFLEKTSYLTYETTVYSAEKKRDDTQKTITRETFMNAVGVGGDPVRAVQDLPGIARSDAFDSNVRIQGSGSDDTHYEINNHEIPFIFHFGGLQSILLPETVDRLEVFTAGYGPELGRAMGGWVGAWLRDPARDRLHGSAFMDVVNAGLVFEGPIGSKSAFMISARQSYVGFILGLIANNNPALNLTVAPTFTDGSAQFITELTPRDTLRILAIGSSDIVQFLFKEPFGQDPALRGNLDNENQFVRLIPELTHVHSRRTVSHLSLGFGRDWAKFNVGSVYENTISTALTAKGDVEREMIDDPLATHWKMDVGFDNRYNWVGETFSLPSQFIAGGISNPLSTGTTQNLSTFQPTDQLGIFMRNEVTPHLSRWSFLPGLRLDYFNWTKEFLPAPRLAVRFKIDDSLVLRTATGVYFQQPDFDQKVAGIGNPNLTSNRALHYSLGADKDLRLWGSNGFKISLEGFGKYLTNLVTSVPDARNFSNEGNGYAVGGDTQVNFNWGPWNASLDYTLSRSVRWDPYNNNGQPFLFDHDQTHILAAQGSFRYRNWRFATRIRYTSGNPYTPVSSAFYDSDNDVYIPIRGTIFSQRLASFFDMDVRIDRKFVFDKWILTVYLDIQNVTNQQNSDQIVYAFDYSKQTTVAILPILPTFGLRGEF